jgi:glycerol-3-phosphate dehydrogenase (NAD(P)+)
LGDLLATANSPLSRNYRFGNQLAAGATEAVALAAIGATVEAPPTARAVVSLADHRGWPVPICRQVVDLLEARVDPREAVRALMERDLRPEADERRP